MNQFISNGTCSNKKFLNLTPVPKKMKRGDFFLNFFLSIVAPEKGNNFFNF